MAVGKKLIIYISIIVCVVVALAALAIASREHCIFDKKFNRMECCARTVRAADGGLACAIGQMVTIYNYPISSRPI